MNIVLSLPYALTSLFVVAAARVPFDVSSVPWRVGVPHRRAVIRAIGSPALLVTHHPTPWKPGRTSLAAAERDLLRRFGQHLVISTTTPPHELPGSVQLARATARALARECHGLLIDPLSGATVPERAEGEPMDFDLADDWLGWDIQRRDAPTCGPLGPSDDTPSRSSRTPESDRSSRTSGSGQSSRAPGLGWSPCAPGSGQSLCAPEPGACDGLSVTSRGLQRFALPEIILDGAACTHRECATGLLRTVAHRLVADHLAFVATHPDTRQRAIDDHLRIEPVLPGDYGEAPFAVRLIPCETGSPEPGRPGATTRLKVAPAGGTDQVTCLRADPPSGFPAALDRLRAGPETRRGSLTSIDCRTPDPSPALAA